MIVGQQVACAAGNTVNMLQKQYDVVVCAFDGADGINMYVNTLHTFTGHSCATSSEAAWCTTHNFDTKDS